MYQNELDRQIKNNTASNSFVFFGESLFLIDRYTKKLCDIEDASVLDLNQDEYTFNSTKAHLSQASLFGGRNVLIIKSHKKIPKKELEVLISYCEKNQDNLFIYAYTGDDHKTYNDKKFLKNCSTMCVRFFNPKHGEAVNIVSEVARKLNVNMDSYAISHLLNIHHGDVALSANEVEKFIVYDRAITTKDIDSLVFGLAEINVDELIKQILNQKDFKKDVQSILEHGEDEIRIITAISTYITGLYMFNIYIRVNGTPNAIEILGYPAPKFVVEDKASMSLKFKPNIYYKLLELLLDSELKMKSYGVDKGAILFSTLIRIQKLL